MTEADRLAELWEDTTARVLASRWGIPELHLYETVGSTNDVARRLAGEGHPPGSVVLADRQLAGRGRAGRPWRSPPGVGIWLSMIAPTPDRPDAAGMLPIRAGLACARASDGFVAPVRVGLKWPNDLSIEGMKIGGVLCEGSWMGSEAGPVIVGVGINVMQRAEDIPEELRGHAASLAMFSGPAISRLAVADSVVPALRDALCRGEHDTADLSRELRDRDVLAGRRVTVSDSDTGEIRLGGMGAGIARDGSLLVRSDEGQVRSVRSGTVRLANAALSGSGDPANR